MSAVPPEIAGLGPSAMKLRVSPGFDPLKAQVGPDEYFVLSRIDGTQSVREVLLSTGLPIDRGIAIVLRLRSIGALLLPGETSAPIPAAPPRDDKPRPGSNTPVAPMTPPQGVPITTPAAAGVAKGNVDIGRAPTLHQTPSEGLPVVPRTATPMTPLPGGREPEPLPTLGRTPSPPSGRDAPAPGRTPTPIQGSGTRPPATQPIRSTPPQGTPALSRTQTPMTPMPGAKLPARSTPTDLEPPTQPRAQLDAPTQRDVPTARGPLPMRPPAPDTFDAPTVQRAPSKDINLVLPNPSDAERTALAEPGDLRGDDRLRILAMARLVQGRDPWALLGVANGANAKELKRAYFKLSKDFHPDRFYGKQLGSFSDRLTVIFEAISRTYAKLTAPEKDRRTGVFPTVNAEQPQTPGEYAAELFDRACGLEVGGDALGAMKLFAAAVRIDPQTRYLRRAATCALAAEQPKTALEYAKKAQTQAPNDPSSARLLASAFKAVGRYGDAEEVLIMAMALKSENDVLTAELRNDLAEVRRLMSG